MVMGSLHLFTEPFAFWLVRVFLDPEDDQTKEFNPLSTKNVIATGTVILIVVALAGALLSR